MAKRRTLLKCFGVNPKTGHRVGERHRWGGIEGRGRAGLWGRGMCAWCYRTIEQLRRVE
jgi:hypothetical protein